MTQGARERLIDFGVIALAIGLAALAVAAHMPGHVSMDSSEQLYEAAVGHSVSWSPPFLSALLRILGGGTQATGAIVLGNVALTYGGLALAFIAGRRSDLASGAYPFRALLISLLVANPLVFLYVGIVWKDVVMASLLSVSAGLLLLSSTPGHRKRNVLAVSALVLLAPMLLVRQQGIILAAPLVAVAALLLAGRRSGGSYLRWWSRWSLVVIVYTLWCIALAGGTQVLIHGSGEKSTAVGFAAVQRYDLTGMIATGDAPRDGLPNSLASETFRDAVRRSYSADRIDFVLNDPIVVDGFWGLEPADVSTAFWAQVRARPGVYLKVKADQFAWLLGARRIDRCLPLHVGVDGNPEYLRAAGVTQGIDARDHQLYEFGLWSRQLVFYRHWFYFALLLAACAYLAVQKRRRAIPPVTVAGALAFSLLAFYGAYALTTIACDFRYLYPGLVGTSTLVIYLLAAGGFTKASSRDGEA